MTTNATRDALHRLAVYVLSPARAAATGKIGLRPTLGGFGTPPFMVDGAARQLRVDQGWLVADDSGVERALDLNGGGQTLASCADFVGLTIDVEANADFDVPAAGDLDAPLLVETIASVELADWFALAASVLARLRSGALGDPQPPSQLQLWPEHFDLAVDLGDEAAGTRANFGASPGDSFSPEPYFYVGPWDRSLIDPAVDPRWNAPFGAVLRQSELSLATARPGSTALRWLSALKTEFL